MIEFTCSGCAKNAPAVLYLDDVRDGEAFIEVAHSPPRGWLQGQTNKIAIIACSVQCFKLTVQKLQREDERSLLTRVLELQLGR